MLPPLAVKEGQYTLPVVGAKVVGRTVGTAETVGANVVGADVGEAATVIGYGSDGMPLATTSKTALPPSIDGGTSK